MDLAMQSSWFKNSRFRKGKGKGTGGAGLGFRDRPAIGYVDSGDSNQVSIYDVVIYHVTIVAIGHVFGL